MNVTDPDRTDPWIRSRPAARTGITAVGVIGVAVGLAAVAVLVVAFSVLVGGHAWLYGTGFVLAVVALAALKIGLRRR